MCLSDGEREREKADRGAGSAARQGAIAGEEDIAATGVLAERPLYYVRHLRCLALLGSRQN